LIPGEGFSDLPGDPLGRGVGSNVGPYQVVSLKPDDHQAVEQLEANSRHDEQIDSTGVWDVIVQEGLPSLRWRTEAAYHVLGDSRLGDVEAQLEQLAVDARRTPKWVHPAHLANESAQLG